MSGTIEHLDALLFIQHLEKHNIGSDTDYVLSRLKMIGAASVLDVGFGRGDLLHKMSNTKQFKLLVGIEKSTALFENAKKTFYDLDIETIHGDFLEYEFSQKFDVVVMSFYLHHLDDYKKHLKKAVTLLNTEGVMVIVDRIARDEHAKEKFRVYWNEYYREQHEWHEDCPTILTLEEIVDEITAYNLEIKFIMHLPNDNRKGVGNFPKTLVEISKRGGE